MLVKKTITEIEIREATDKDLSSILSLYSQPDMDNGQVLSIAQSQKLFDRIKSYPDYKIYAAETRGKIVGTFTLLIMDNIAHMGAPSGIIEDVAVEPECQGKGIGRRMMEFAMDLCRKKGCYKLALSSNLKRKDAHSFYESLGFKKHGHSFIVEFTNK